MFIQTEDTPNPETIKFIPGQPVMPKGIIEFDAVEKAMKSPLAKQIFAVKGVSSVFLAGDFVSVTKEEDASWMILKPKILATIMDHYMSGMPVIEESALSGIDEQDNSKNADMLSEIECPVFLQWGEADTLLPMRDNMPGCTSRVRDLRVRTYPGVGHMPMEEIPAQSLADFRYFLHKIDL